MIKRVIILVLLSVILLSGVSFAASGLNVLVWIGYLAPDVQKNFESTYDAKLNVTYYNTYDEMFNLIQTNQYDVLITGELAFPILIANGQLEPFDKNQIPNIKNLDPLFKGLSFDPDNKYSLPYHYIYIGLIYDKARVKKEDVTLQNYFEAPARFKGRITSFPDKRIMTAMAMKYMGQSLNNTDKKNLDLCAELLKGLKDNLTESGKSLNRGVVDPYSEILEGKADIAICYVAESTRRLFNANDKIGFVLPREGAIIGTDDIAIPKGAKNLAMAHKFINFLYDPKTAALSVNTFGNPFPVRGVKDLILPELANNPEIYPPMEVVKNLEFFIPMSAEQLAVYDTVWSKAFGQ